MDHIEQWLVELADRFPNTSGEHRGVLIAASTWHEEGPAVLAKKAEAER